ncbi:hypothetical protein KIH87_02385 [Paraneptunicella aestuarii]|uniref:hypothetical protein n=1 Tax=Paraneptunicella aestuarii TaxID=2831148 RepID=UPI001E2C7B0C|nr:hypothetical protein [Paraneptunicella aestuarii]UAA39232.1 hypothetical protein KIH87_02385 [Paraneptunicella aestuarii]
MNKEIQNPPKLAMKLLEWLLPEKVKEEISGDLIEEFNGSDEPLKSRNFKFWHQTLATCWRYSINKQAIYTGLGVSLILSVFFVMLTAITFLAFGSDEVFEHPYWTTGALHQFFLESLFWDSLANGLMFDASIGLLFNIPSCIWTVGCFLVLHWFERRERLNLRNYLFFAFTALALPYGIGMLYFNVNQVPLREAGPIIAFMWLPIVYMIIPLGFALLKRWKVERMTLNV